MSMRILVTGFDPFGGESINPAWEAVRLLPEMIGGAEILRFELPTVFGEAGARLGALMETHRPDRVLCVGQAGGRAAITVEQVALNLRRASIPDNAGCQPIEEPVLPGGPDGYLAAWDVPGAAEAIREAGIPAAVSYSAGTFVCNDLFYTLLHLIRRAYPAVRGGFVHVPYLPEQAARRPSPTPSMSLPDIVTGLEAAARFLVSEAAR